MYVLHVLKFDACNMSPNFDGYFHFIIVWLMSDCQTILKTDK